MTAPRGDLGLQSGSLSAPISKGARSARRLSSNGAVKTVRTMIGPDRLVGAPGRIRTCDTCFRSSIQGRSYFGQHQGRRSSLVAQVCRCPLSLMSGVAVSRPSGPGRDRVPRGRSDGRPTSTRRVGEELTASRTMGQGGRQRLITPSTDWCFTLRPAVGPPASGQNSSTSRSSGYRAR